MGLVGLWRARQEMRSLQASQRQMAVEAYGYSELDAQGLVLDFTAAMITSVAKELPEREVVRITTRHYPFPLMTKQTSTYQVLLHHLNSRQATSGGGSKLKLCTIRQVADESGLLVRQKIVIDKRRWNRVQGALVEHGRELKSLKEVLDQGVSVIAFDLNLKK